MPETKSKTEAKTAAEIPSVGDAFAGLLDEVARDVVGWIPEREGDTLAGVIVGDEIITTSFDDQATGERVTSDLPVSVFDVDPTRDDIPFVRFVWMGTVLLNAYRRHTPTRLDQVAVRLTRKSRGTGVGDYDDWRVIVHKAPENERPSLTLGSVRRTPGERPAAADQDPAEERF